MGAIFDVETISIATIVYNRLKDEADTNAASPLNIAMDAKLVESGDDLLVGSVGLIELYKFLLAYREKTGDLDQLLMKRTFAGSFGGRGKVNKGMQTTLRDAPQRFGL